MDRERETAYIDAARRAVVFPDMSTCDLRSRPVRRLRLGGG
jgi:hypothetical protein